MRAYLIIPVLMAIPSVAFADDLDDSAAICAANRLGPIPHALLGSQSPRTTEYKIGYEHCVAIAAAQSARSAPKPEDAAALQKTLDTAKKLGVAQ